MTSTWIFEGQNSHCNNVKMKGHHAMETMSYIVHVSYRNWKVKGNTLFVKPPMLDGSLMYLMRH